MATACTYCDQNVAAHDPVFVAERDDGERVPAGQFCNCACLASWIDEEGLTAGAACEWSPG